MVEKLQSIPTQQVIVDGSQSYQIDQILSLNIIVLMFLSPLFRKTSSFL